MAIYKAQHAGGRRPPSKAGQLLRRFTQLGVFAALVGVLLWGVLSLETRQYGARARVQIQVAGKDLTQGLASAGMDSRLLASQLEVLSSREIAGRVATRAGLAHDPEFNGAQAGSGLLTKLGVFVGLAPNLDYLPAKERVMRAFQNQVRVQQIRSSGFLSVGFRSTDPQKAARIANLLAETYVDWLGVLPARTNEQRSNRLQSEIEVLRTQIAVTEEALLLQSLEVSASQPAAARPVTAADQERLVELRSQLILAAAARQQLEKRVELLREGLKKPSEMRPSVELASSAHLQQLLEQQVKTQMRVEKLSEALLPSHPQLKRMLREQAGLRRRVEREGAKALTGLEGEVKRALAKETQLKSSLGALNSAPQPQPQAGSGMTARVDPGGKAQRAALQADRRRLAELQAQFKEVVSLQKVNEGKVTASIITRAMVDHVPVFPKTRPIVLAGMLAAFVLGAILMLLRAILFRPSHNRRWNDASEGMEIRRESHPPQAAAVAPEPAMPMTEKRQPAAPSQAA